MQGIPVSSAAYREAHREELREIERQRRAARGEQGRSAERARARMTIKRFRANLRILKAAQGCADCGTRTERLDYHHEDPSTKKYTVSRMHKCSLKTLLDEIAKCVVLCAPCHTRRHWTMRTFG
jgi:hypothetical protein